ncbi:MAG TPA: YwiC-like family protein, partial [Nitrospirota bacterium]
VKGYLLKEYGSWSVLSIAFLIGLGVTRGFSWQAVPLFLSLGLLVNSKQALSKWIRKTWDRGPLLIFIGQIAVAAAILLLLFGTDIMRLLPLLVFPAGYLLSNKLSGEHGILTELLGFVLLSLAAVLAKFLIINGLDVRLFVAVALYFCAGVFKIKAVLRKKTSDRITAAAYALFAAIVYHRMHIPVIILLPLIENIIVSATLYRVPLRTTGWIEVAKSLAFLWLMIAFF